MGYHFPPMMPFYGRFVTAPTEWLMSPEGRRLIAKTLRHCRAKHGRDEARRFRDALIFVGCLYPLLRAFRDANL